MTKKLTMMIVLSLVLVTMEKGVMGAQKIIDEVRNEFRFLGACVDPRLIETMTVDGAEGKLFTIKASSTNLHPISYSPKEPCGYEEGKQLTDYHSFSYAVVGTLKNGFQVLETKDSGVGSGLFEHLLVVEVISGTKGAIQLKVKKIVDLGNRYRGTLRLVDNKIIFQSNCDHLSMDDPTSCKEERIEF